MEPATPDARAVVAELQRRATARRPRWQPRPLPSPPVRTPMTVDGSLEYLHTHWVLPDRLTEVPAGPRWKQLVWRVAGRLTFGVLERYLADERELLSRAVQVCDTLARRVDTLEAELDTLAQAASGQLSVLATYLPDPSGTGAPDDGPASDELPSGGAAASGDPASGDPADGGPAASGDPAATELSAVRPPVTGPAADPPGDGASGGGEPGR